MELAHAFALAALIAAPALAQDAAEPVTPASVVAAAPASDWRAIDPADLLVMTLAPDRDANPRQVVIQLMPPPFSRGWVGNIRTLAKAHWWDGTSVYRVVDNWVAQWGDGEDDEAKAKPLPEELREVPESEYVADPVDSALREQVFDFAAAEYPELFDNYSFGTSHWRGWPYATDHMKVWPTHCYGSVGVARSIESTGTGSELYAVIGHAPRQLDRNIAVVGRVIEGIEHLSTLPRGKGDAGVYDDAALRVPIVSVRLGDDLAEAGRPQFEYLDGDSFTQYVHVRANRNDPFYKVGAGGVDVCNVQVPIRRIAR